MKKRLFIFLFIIVLFALTSCVKKEHNKEESSTPTAICTSKEDLNEIKIETKTTMTFNKDNYATSQKIESTQTYANKELYDIYASNIKETVEAAKDSRFFEYTYSLNEKKLQISTMIVYKDVNFDFNAITDEEKSNLLAAKMIKKVEDSGEKCEITGVTRKDLGL